MKLGDIISDGWTPCPLCEKLTWRGQVCSECLKAIENDETGCDIPEYEEEL